MKKDPIVDEIHALREAKAKAFNYNMEAIFADLKQKQAGRKNISSRKPVRVAEQRAECVGNKAEMITQSKI